MFVVNLLSFYKRKAQLKKVLFTTSLHNVWCTYAIALLCYLCRNHFTAKELSTRKKTFLKKFKHKLYVKKFKLHCTRHKMEYPDGLYNN